MFRITNDAHCIHKFNHHQEQCATSITSTYTGWPPKKRNSLYSRFLRTCSDQQLSFFTLLDRASFPHNNTKIIKFGWELLILWVISHALSFSGFVRFPEFQGTITDSFSSTCASTYQLSLIVPRNSGNWTNPENDSP